MAMNDLQQLLSTRSILTQGILDYLNGIIGSAPRVLGFRSGATFEGLRQKVRVMEDRAAFEQLAAERREALHRAGMELDGVAYDPLRAVPENATHVAKATCVNQACKSRINPMVVAGSVREVGSAMPKNANVWSVL